MRRLAEWRLGVCDQWSGPSLDGPSTAGQGGSSWARHGGGPGRRKASPHGPELLELQHHGSAGRPWQDSPLNSSTQMINSPPRVTVTPDPCWLPRRPLPPFGHKPLTRSSPWLSLIALLPGRRRPAAPPFAGDGTDPRGPRTVALWWCLLGRSLLIALGFSGQRFDGGSSALQLVGAGALGCRSWPGVVVGRWMALFGAGWCAQWPWSPCCGGGS